MGSIAGARPIRSALFVPGNKEEWMRKATRYGADALIFDLEDSVPADQKAVARKMVRRVTQELGSQGYIIFARVNDFTTSETGDDLEGVVCPELHGVMLPKSRDANDIVALSALLDHFERRNGVPNGQILIKPLPETALSIRLVYEMATASPRVEYIGTAAAVDGDGARAFGYESTPERSESIYIRQRGLADARAAGIQYPISGMWTDIGDLEGLRAYAGQTRRIGYTGMLCIHPSHVPVINEVFTPTPKQIAHWQSVIASLDEAQRQGASAIRHAGALIDIAHIKHARQKLDFARQLGLVK